MPERDRPAAYDHTQRSQHTLAECEAAVGRSATLTLTGTLVDSGASEWGPYVKFEVDERWGLTPGYRLVMDLECFELEPVTRTFTLRLADKPRDLLVYLVEHGPCTTVELAKAFDAPARGSLYTGGLSTLKEIGLAEVYPMGMPDQSWRATEEGARLVAESRVAEEVRDVG